MEVHSTRFGRIEYSAEEVICFPEGLWGFPDCREWLILADAHTDALAWMQSLNRPDIAMAVASPRRFVPGYQARVSRCEVEPLRFDNAKTAKVLAILGNNGRSLTLNLKAPVVVNLDRRLGRQVIVNGDWPLQYELEDAASLKKSA
jgi:flagellar assembly factor FliW